MSTTVWIILGGALLTYVARAAGYIIVTRFERIHPRVEAGLNAVPAAVLTTLFAPAAFHGGVPEITALIVAGLIALRGGLMPMFIAGTVVLVGMRALLG